MCSCPDPSRAAESGALQSFGAPADATDEDRMRGGVPRNGRNMPAEIQEIINMAMLYQAAQQDPAFLDQLYESVRQSAM